MFVKPAQGLKVRDPRTLQLIPASGIEVPDNDFFWIKRLQEGDVVKATAPAAAPATPTQAPEAHKPNEAAIAALEGAIKELEATDATGQEKAQ